MGQFDLAPPTCKHALRVPANRPIETTAVGFAFECSIFGAFKFIADRRRCRPFFTDCIHVVTYSITHSNGNCARPIENSIAHGIRITPSRRSLRPTPVNRSTRAARTVGRWTCASAPTAHADDIGRTSTCTRTQNSRKKSTAASRRPLPPNQTEPSPVRSVVVSNSMCSDRSSIRCRHVNPPAEGITGCSECGVCVCECTSVDVFGGSPVFAIVCV